MKTLKLAAAVVAVSGCMTAHAPALRLEKSMWTMRYAAELGAADVPLARAHLQRAREEQEAARRLANAGDPRAETVLMCAEADAELALALSREALAHRAAVKAETELAALRWQGGGQ
jgi:hypothetical protein